VSTRPSLQINQIKIFQTFTLHLQEYN